MEPLCVVDLDLFQLVSAARDELLQKPPLTGFKKVDYFTLVLLSFLRI
jgi:hypothetical protein